MTDQQSILNNADCIQVSKNIVLQWGELPTSVAYIGTGQIMGWGNKAIEIRFGYLSCVQSYVYSASGVSRLVTWTGCSCTKRRKS